MAEAHAVATAEALAPTPVVAHAQVAAEADAAVEADAGKQINRSIELIKGLRQTILSPLIFLLKVKGSQQLSDTCN